MNTDPLGEWAERAACKGLTTDWWYSTGDCHEASAARRVCASCPVFTECREWANLSRQKYGIFGGEDEFERERRWRLERKRKHLRPLPWRDHEILTLDQRAARAAFGHPS